MRRLVLEIFASEKSNTQMKGRVRKPVADGVNDKTYMLLNAKSLRGVTQSTPQNRLGSAERR